MKLTGWLITFILLGIIAVICYPLYYPYIHSGKKEAYEQIVSFHQQNHAPLHGGVPHTISITQMQRPFLYLSWFSTGDSRHGDEFMAYPDGWIMGRRVLWSYAVQGWGGLAQTPSALLQLEHLPCLPASSVNPGDVPYERLLIVSQYQNNVWHTFYYDRSQLPLPVHSMLQIAGPLGNVPH